jgi:hypothetical protein
MKRNLFVFFSLLLLSSAILWSCQKELSTETGGNPGTGGGGSGTGNIGWSFTSGSTNYSGCIDTAQIDALGTTKMLTVDASDAAGNSFTISLLSPTGTFAAGTYTTATGATIVLTTAAGDIYTAVTPTSFNLQVSSINDSVVVATFSATLTSPLSGATFVITNGKIKALIDRPNVCGGTGGTTAVFAIDNSGASCGTVNGIYKKDTALKSSNTLTLKVNVTTAGSWSYSTSAINGMTFSGNGTFTATGAQTITLSGSGTPTVGGSNTVPVTIGTGTCNFVITVETVVTPPCTPANNTVTFASGGFPPIDVTSTTTTTTGTYKIVGTGTVGDITLDFFGTTQPTAGVYTIKPSTGTFAAGDVRVTLMASGGAATFTSSTGNLYVTITAGKVVATFCDVSFSATIMGAPVTSLVSGKVTEQ